MRKCNIVGLDLGYNQTKIRINSGAYKFISLVGEPSSLELAKLKAASDIFDDLRVNVDGKEYYVGKKAQETENPTLCTETGKADSVNERIVSSAALGIVNHYSDISAGISIVTGLPAEDYANEMFKRDLRNSLIGHRSFKFRGDIVEVSVKDVTVLPQAVGAFFDYCLDDNGAPKEELVDEIFTGTVIIIDIGYKTTDVVFMVNGDYSSTGVLTVNKGMRDIHKELRRAIKKDFTRSLSLFDMDDICRSGYLEHEGEKRSVQKQITEAANSVARAIFTEINAEFDDKMFSARKIVGVGGTMSLLESHFKEVYKDRYITIKNPEYSNANGYYKYGLMSRGAEVSSNGGGIENNNKGK